ncbi:transposable element Tcb1 transposase [Trichonephila clavipes]|nr:transposable element Tcb1 transposase [Trichonephila clavipes]
MGRSVSAETVRNVIRHAGYSSRVARKKPFISLQNQKKRLEFAKTQQLKTDNFWKKVIFSDENKFNIFGSDGRHTVWRKPNTAFDPKNLRPTVKHGGGSVMGMVTVAEWSWPRTRSQLCFCQVLMYLKRHHTDTLNLSELRVLTLAWYGSCSENRAPALMPSSSLDRDSLPPALVHLQNYDF